MSEKSTEQNVPFPGLSAWWVILLSFNFNCTPYIRCTSVDTVVVLIAWKAYAVVVARTSVHVSR